MKKGLCLEGQLRKPKDCKDSPVCTILDKALVSDDSYLSLSGCINTDEVKLSIGLEDVKLSPTTSLSCRLGFDAQISTNPSIAISAEADLAVKLGDSELLFKGKLSGKLSGSATQQRQTEPHAARALYATVCCTCAALVLHVCCGRCAAVGVCYIYYSPSRT